VAELSRWCGRCGTELRSGARFCSKCGQRVIEDTTRADAPGPGHEESEPGQPSGPGSTAVAVEPAAPAPGPNIATRNDISRQPSGPGSTETPEEPAAPAPGPNTATRDDIPRQPSEPDSTETPPEPAAPAPGPNTATQDEWSHWYRSTEPRGPFEAPVSGPLTNQPPASPAPARQPQGYQPPGYQPRPYQPPVYPQSAAPYPGYQQPHRAPESAQPGAPLASPRSPIPPRPPRGPAGGGRPSRATLFWSALFAVSAVVVVVVLALLHPLNRHETINEAAKSIKTARPTISAAAGSPTASPSSSTSPQSSPSASASTSASLSSTAVTEQQAASTVAGMLASSVTDRTAIDSAYTDVDRCGPNLDRDAAVFTRAASSRRALLASLATMPGRSALPPALLGDLTTAWWTSIAADQGFATWANDEVSEGCVADDTNDPGYRASVAPDGEATEFKTDFAAEWNPIATRYGLTTYQQSQL
jgi:hypothetical protein